MDFKDSLNQTNKKAKIRMQILIFILTFTNILLKHCPTKTWIACSKALSDLYGFQDSDIANMNSTFSICVTIGQILTGSLADKYPPNKLIFIMYVLLSIYSLC
jgi:sugar phosphate permease